MLATVKRSPSAMSTGTSDEPTSVTRIQNRPVSARRISALVLRYLYLLIGSWPRMLELIYWPMFQLILWGFITKHLLTNSSWVAEASGVLIAAVLLWDILFRSQMGYSISFLEEMWSRNLGHLFVSPLRPYEMIAGLTCISLLRTLLGVVPATLVAIPLYHYSIYEIGLPLIAFFINLLVFGWALGMIITAVILRAGLGAESFAWLAVFAIAPISAIYYPVSVLPSWLQPVAWAMPPAYVFEGMRTVLFKNEFQGELLAQAMALNMLYLAIGLATFLYSFRVARQRGLLLQIGE